MREDHQELVNEASKRIFDFATAVSVKIAEGKENEGVEAFLITIEILMGSVMSFVKLSIDDIEMRKDVYKTIYESVLRCESNSEIRNKKSGPCG